jgi:hypothetical protein
LLVDRVVVTDDDVEIRYVVPTTPESEKVRFCHLRTDYFRNPQPIRSYSAEVPMDKIRSGYSTPVSASASLFTATKAALKRLV